MTKIRPDTETRTHKKFNIPIDSIIQMHNTRIQTVFDIYGQTSTSSSEAIPTEECIPWQSKLAVSVMRLKPGFCYNRDSNVIRDKICVKMVNGMGLGEYL